MSFFVDHTITHRKSMAQTLFIKQWNQSGSNPQLVLFYLNKHKKTVTMTLPMALSLKGDKFYTYMSVQTSYAVDIAQMHRTGTHIYAHCPPIRFHPAHVREPSLQSSGITVRCMTVGNPTTKRETPHYCCDYLSQNNKMMRAYHSPQRNAQHA